MHEVAHPSLGGILYNRTGNRRLRGWPFMWCCAGALFQRIATRFSRQRRLTPFLLATFMPARPPQAVHPLCTSHRGGTLIVLVVLCFSQLVLSRHHPESGGRSLRFSLHTDVPPGS